MNAPIFQIVTAVILLGATGQLVCQATAANFDKAVPTTPSVFGTSNAAQQVATDPNTTLIQPAPSTPAIKKATTPGAAQVLNPQPLPTKSATDVKVAPGVTQTLNPQPLSPKSASQPLNPGITQSLNPQPLPPKLSTPGTLPATPSLGSHTATPTIAKTAASAAKLPKNFYNMDDHAIIIVSGKPVPAGAIKQAINAQISKQSGPPKTVTAVARKLDRVALGVIASTAGSKIVPLSSMQQSLPPSGGKTGINAKNTGHISTGSSATQATAISKNISGTISELRCTDKGPPKISAVVGKLRPGSKVTIDGLCFGDRPGRVELIGQFPSGKLSPAFTAWDMTGIVLEIPANISGATDHAVAVSVITADGKTSPAMQAQFQAARARVDVPESRWSPTASFDKTDAGDMSMSSNSAYRGTLVKSVRVNPQCALDTMDVLVIAGGVSGIHGFEQGPPNEAAVTIDWQGACTGATIWTKHQDFIISQGDDLSFTSACHVALQARAWAYCPVGVAP